MRTPSGKKSLAGSIGIDHLDGTIDEVDLLLPIRKMLFGLLIGELKDLQTIWVGGMSGLSSSIILDGHILMGIGRLDITIDETNETNSTNSGGSIG